MSDLRQRVPGHSLIDMLLHQWDLGTIRLDASTNDVVVGEDAVSWYRGVIGERRVGTILGLLSDSHTVLHSVPVGKGSSDIDHVVIGRAGVFSINTKYSPGKRISSAGYGMYVDGRKRHYVRNSVAEARRAGELLSAASGLTVPVTALIVFVNPGPITHKAPAGGDAHEPEVRVLADDDLFRVFMDRPVFSEEQVERIAAAAVLPATWHRSPSESTVGDHITREFEALEEAVGPHLARAYTAPPKAPAPNARNRDRRPAASRSRPAAARRPSSRKRQSAFERLFRSLLLPVMGLVGFVMYVNSITGT
ncbi:nuclease-related domain-containing protein [Salinibacterium sp.]|uniref:nuclease-related domain-containing protein n=1 Tax=Salinibacterium sp. TaxID=1915057 RepID=UPI00286CFF89|nr:nuclease-related domain-containing protein [Salinibacterium sp.]